MHEILLMKNIQILDEMFDDTSQFEEHDYEQMQYHLLKEMFETLRSKHLLSLLQINFDEQFYLNHYLNMQTVKSQK